MAGLERRFWFQLHGWFSLPVWMVFCFVCLTGTLAVVSHELTWLTNPNARAVNAAGVEPIPVAAAITALQQAHPTAAVQYVAIREPYLTYVVYFADKDLPVAQAYVNQYSGAVQEVVTGITFIDFMRGLHGWLLFPWEHNYSVGYYLVALMSVVMMGALVTGLVVYKSFWRAYWRPQIRPYKGFRTLLHDLHRAVGAWSLWFLAVIASTGLWYLTQAVLWHNNVETEPHAPLLAAESLPPYTEAGQREFTVSVQEALNVASGTYPGFSPAFVVLPEHSRDTYKLLGDTGSVFFDGYSYQVAVNPWDGQVEGQMDPARMGPLQTLMHLADPLHYGNIGGLWTKVIWFVFGLLVTGMSITGFMMWHLRVFKEGRKKTRKQRPAGARARVPAIQTSDKEEVA